MKDYYLMFNVGKIKYLVNYHNGNNFYDDKSKFYDIKSFSNKKKMNKFVKELEQNGYTERSFLTNNK